MSTPTNIVIPNTTVVWLCLQVYNYELGSGLTVNVKIWVPNGWILARKLCVQDRFNLCRRIDFFMIKNVKL